VALGILAVSEGLVPVMHARLGESGPAFIGFDAARIEFDPGAGKFHAELLVSEPFSGFTGLWRARRDLVLTAIVA
jgi:hypothetical protein